MEKKLKNLFSPSKKHGLRHNKNFKQLESFSTAEVEFFNYLIFQEFNVLIRADFELLNQGEKNLFSYI